MAQNSEKHNAAALSQALRCSIPELRGAALHVIARTYRDNPTQGYRNLGMSSALWYRLLRQLGAEGEGI